MKKQILFLTFFTLALVFAGMNKSFGQNSEPNYLDVAPTYSTPAVGLGCASAGDALSPLPGVTYNYSITVTAGSTVNWFVTDNVNVIAANTLTTDIDPDGGGGNYILDAEDGVYNNGSNTTTDIDISWKTFDPTTTVLLVAYAVDAAGCTDNVEVYRIQPSFAFTLDIAGILDDGTSGASECVSPVVSAQYDGTDLLMDYGENWVFYSVTAANWVHSWQPSFTSGMVGGSTLGTVQWAYPDEAYGAGSVWHDATDVVEASHYSATAIGAAGESIILRIQVDHGTNELDAGAATVTVGVNGVMYDPASAGYGNTALQDMDDDGSGNCVNDVTDSADYTLTPRPALNAVSPTPFVGKN
jgi:hypothetical protein